MSYIEFEGKQIPTDDEGYLLSLNDYSEGLRDHIASLMGLELTTEHLVIIAMVRKYYEEFDTTPPIRGLIKLLQKEGHEELASSVKLARLFPDGAAKCAAKLAGLPKPAKCIQSKKKEPIQVPFLLTKSSTLIKLQAHYQPLVHLEHLAVRRLMNHFCHQLCQQLLRQIPEHLDC